MVRGAAEVVQFPTNANGEATGNGCVDCVACCYQLNPSLPFAQCVAQYHDTDSFPLFKPSVDAGLAALHKLKKAKNPDLPEFAVPASANRVTEVCAMLSGLDPAAKAPTSIRS